MITITSNIGEVITSITAKLRDIDTKRISLAIANEIVGDWRKRIHMEGKDSDDNQIGKYSDGYMKVRTGNFVNRASVSRGKNKGQPKQGTSGVFTKGKNKGRPRPVYNRSNDSTVVASLTREMENTMRVFELQNGAGIGWDDRKNYEKSHWVEDTYDKNIYKLTESELQTVREIASNELSRILAA